MTDCGNHNGGTGTRMTKFRRRLFPLLPDIDIPPPYGQSPGTGIPGTGIPGTGIPGTEFAQDRTAESRFRLFPRHASDRDLFPGRLGRRPFVTERGSLGSISPPAPSPAAHGDLRGREGNRPYPGMSLYPGPARSDPRLSVWAGENASALLGGIRTRRKKP